MGQLSLEDAGSRRLNYLGHDKRVPPIGRTRFARGLAKCQCADLAHTTASLLQVFFPPAG